MGPDMKMISPEVATPIDPDEQHSLIPSHITTMEELNRWEQENINRAEVWFNARKRGDILTIAFARKLHKKMFEDVWRWAGTFRTSLKNIGVPAWQISIELQKLFDDVGVWISRGTYCNDEIAARFHHRLVYIHPFPNGNGRHSRLMTGLLQKQVLHEKEFSWGKTDLAKATDLRNTYIRALQDADKNDYSALISFCRS